MNGLLSPGGRYGKSTEFTGSKRAALERLDGNHAAGVFTGCAGRRGRQRADSARLAGGGNRRQSGAGQVARLEEGESGRRRDGAYHRSGEGRRKGGPAEGDQAHWTREPRERARQRRQRLDAGFAV